MKVASEKLTFPGALGHDLAARYDRPAAGTPKAYAVFAHCFSCSKDVFAARRVSEGLARLGIAVLRFDFTGLGQSEGDFANTNFSSNVDDLVRAADFLRETHAAPQLLVGHSLGGAAAILAAARIPETRAVATIGAPADARHVSLGFADKIDEIRSAGEAEVSLAGRPFKIKAQFLDDIEGQGVIDAVGALKRPIAIFHAPRDETVGIDHASQLFAAAKHPKSFVSLDDADHLLTGRAAAEHVAAVLAAWASRYLPEDGAPREAGAAEGFEAPANGAASRFSGAGRLAQDARAGGHRLTIDGGRADGGDDLGPNPTQTVEAALAACATITMRLYADRKGWALTGATVQVRPDPDAKQDAHALKAIIKEISIEGDLDAAQRERLVEIADRCPVHRMLTETVSVTSRLADE